MPKEKCSIQKIHKQSTENAGNIYECSGTVRKAVALKEWGVQKGGES